MDRPPRNAVLMPRQMPCDAGVHIEPLALAPCPPASEFAAGWWGIMVVVVIVAVAYIAWLSR
jgi:hypothetical protein